MMGRQVWTELSGRISHPVRPTLCGTGALAVSLRPPPTHKSVVGGLNVPFRNRLTDRSESLVQGPCREGIPPPSPPLEGKVPSRWFLFFLAQCLDQYIESEIVNDIIYIYIERESDDTP